PSEIVAGHDGHQQEAEDHRPRIATRQPDQSCDRGRRRNVATLPRGLWWSDEIARLNVNAVMHSGGRKRGAGRPANGHSTVNVLRIRASALSNTVQPRARHSPARLTCDKRTTSSISR